MALDAPIYNGARCSIEFRSKEYKGQSVESQTLSTSADIVLHPEEPRSVWAQEYTADSLVRNMFTSSLLEVILLDSYSAPPIPS